MEHFGSGIFEKQNFARLIKKTKVVDNFMNILCANFQNVLKILFCEISIWNLKIVGNS